jgi:hypothetical protein
MRWSGLQFELPAFVVAECSCTHLRRQRAESVVGTFLATLPEPVSFANVTELLAFAAGELR